ncbi:MAG: tetratricopeptide repeat protein [Bryobacteraceae bacterium]
MHNSGTLLAIALAAITTGSAQQSAACHKGHVDAGYKMTPMPPPKRMTGIGTSSLKITTKSAAAQAYFSQGIELLHCFWDFEAYRAFKEAARLDPSAPMAYWGIVESIDNYKAMDSEKTAALEKIKKLMEKASDHEQFYLRAQQKKEDKDAKDSDDDFSREMEALVDKYPDDLDAKLFLAISSPYGYDSDGRPKAKALFPLMILRNILTDHPDNAAANHYLIHVLEAGPHADGALHSAEILAKLAPNSGHMVHMPGHIYYKLGDQELARNAFLASMKVDEDYMHREHVSTVDDWNYNHNLSYLIASDAEAGRYKEALDMAARLDALPANPFLAVGKPIQATTIGATTVRLQIRFGNWEAAVNHPVELGDEKLAGAPARTYRDGLLTYARGMNALDKKDFASAAREADALDAMQWRLKSDPSGDEEEEDSKPGRVFDLLETASLDLRGNLKCAQGYFDQGMDLLKKAAAKEKKDIGYNEPPVYSRPESESIGYAYLHAKQFDKARGAFEDELIQRPNSGHALYGLAHSYELAGDRSKAAQAYGKFLQSWANADPDLPMVKHARAAAH